MNWSNIHYVRHSSLFKLLGTISIRNEKRGLKQLSGSLKADLPITNLLID